MINPKIVCTEFVQLPRWKTFTKINKTHTVLLIHSFFTIYKLLCGINAECMQLLRFMHANWS